MLPIARARLRRSLLIAFLVAVITLPLSAQEGPTPNELVVAYGTKTVTLDPLHTFTALESQLFTALYEGLLTTDPVTLAPRPGVAARWEASDGGRRYRFFLRPDAHYSNGDRVLAGDFVDSWLRMIEPAAKAEYSFLFDIIKGVRAWRDGKLTDRAQLGFRAASDSVLEVELERPAAHFLVLLTHIAFVPLHSAYRNQRQSWDEARALVCNGPFFLASRTPTEMVLEKNRRYWDEPNVELDRIRVRFFDDPAAATTEFLAGRVQWSTIGEWEKIDNPNQVEAFPMFATSFFSFACDRAPWSDWRVRRGLALLLPWDEVRSKDFLFPTSRLVPAIPSYPEVKGIEARDTAAGRALLAEAGFPNGRGLPKLVVEVFSAGLATEAAKRMATAWKDAIGLEVELRTLAGDTWGPAARSADRGLSVSTWIGDYADPLTFLQLFTTGSNLNDAGFSDPGYDAAIDEAIGILDNTRRYRRMADAEGVLLEKAVVLPMYNSATVNFIDLKRIDGWYPNMLDLHPFRYLHYKTGKVPDNVVRSPVPARDSTL